VDDGCDILWKKERRQGKDTATNLKGRTELRSKDTNGKLLRSSLPTEKHHPLGSKITAKRAGLAENGFSAAGSRVYNSMEGQSRLIIEGDPKSSPNASRALGIARSP